MKVIIWGGTGQCKVVRPILERCGHEIVAVFDDSDLLPNPFYDVPTYHGNSFEKWRRLYPSLGFVIAIGNPYGHIRLEIQDRLVGMRCVPISVIHPTAFIDIDVSIGVGCQILAGANIITGCILGRQVIVNTHASVDHECMLEDGVEVAPGATLCGNVTLKTGSTVYAGATILPRVTIGEDAIVGAGAVVRRDVEPRTTVVGVPARRIK